jgi:hypothetical protein
MEIKNQIELVLLDIGKSIKIHTIDKNNTIIEIDYNKYVDELLRIFNEHYQNSQQH